MPSALHSRFVPLDEYFTLDTEGTAERWEWRNGELFCMTGAQPEHNLVCINVGAELRTRLRGSGCLTFTSDQRVKVRAGSPYLYPDLSVACVPQYVTINGLRTLLNPVLIVEVLSPSTAQDDQGSKFMQYQSIDSLAGYLLVDSTAVAVRHFRKEGDVWVPRLYERPGEAVELPEIGIAVPLAEVYLDTGLL